MKTLIIILNILIVILFLAYLGYTYLKGVASSYSTAQKYTTDLLVPFLWSSVIIIIVSIIFSHKSQGRTAVIRAFLPIIYFVVGVVFFAVQEINVTNQRDQRDHDRVQNKVKNMTKDYIYTGNLPYELYITYDKEDEELVLLEVYYGGMSYMPVAKLKGEVMALLSSKDYYTLSDHTEINYREFKDKNGKTIFDNFTFVNTSKGQSGERLSSMLSEYHIEKYDTHFDTDNSQQ